MEITSFVNESLNANLRVIDRDSEPWFIAGEVCKSLELGNVTAATKDLDDDERGLIEINTSGGKQNVLVISESGLYGLISQSRKPEAKPFKRWVRKEVLPSIRKTGTYSVKQTEKPEVLMAKAVLKLSRQVKYLEARDEKWGNKTPYGEISQSTGNPKTIAVTGHLRSPSRKTVTTTTTTEITEYQPELFNPLDPDYEHKIEREIEEDFRDYL